jgi:hypothetical protein
MDKVMTKKEWLVRIGVFILWILAGTLLVRL